ncbi:MAG: SHOCT domain-containing protein, partial [Clostridia bacterium]|nr:SHOCT domain-containing protein [Clostridia bacterium]
EFQQRLAKLQALCNQGIITDEEYDVALAKLRAEEQK